MGRARAEDVVYLATPSGAQSRAKATGRIKDYNGRELILESSAAEKRYPADQVVGIETDWSPPRQAADELSQRGEFAAALAKYEEALRAETRRWAQRKIVVEMIWCARNLGQPRRAGELFVALARDDPALLDIECIPLAWLAGQPPSDLEKKSREWLASDTPVAVLLGASHLLSIDDRAAIVKRLAPIAAGKDKRLAALARALEWNATFATASATQLAAWSDEIETFPAPLRAGPYFVLGRAFAQHQQFDDAALNFMHLPILYPQDRALAATSLLAAGRALEQAGQPDAAARVYRELLNNHGSSRSAAEARQRLQQLEAKVAVPHAGG